MKLNDIVTRMMDYAAKVKNHEISCAISRIAYRLEHQGAICEKPLTKSEKRIIKMFM